MNGKYQRNRLKEPAGGMVDRKINLEVFLFILKGIFSSSVLRIKLNYIARTDDGMALKFKVLAQNK